MKVVYLLIHLMKNSWKRKKNIEMKIKFCYLAIILWFFLCCGWCQKYEEKTQQIYVSSRNKLNCWNCPKLNYKRKNISILIEALSVTLVWKITSSELITNIFYKMYWNLSTLTTSLLTPCLWNKTYFLLYYICR